MFLWIMYVSRETCMILYMYGSVVGVMEVGRYKSVPMEGGMGAECLHRGVWGREVSPLKTY
jgi:hypothetical protein